MGESASNRGRTRPGAVFLFFACLYILTIGRGFYSSDGEVMFKTAAALVERHSFALEADPGLPQILRGQGDRFFSKYDPGLPLLLIPFYVTGDWIAQVNHAHRTQLAATFALLLPALAGAGSLAALSASLTPKSPLHEMERGLAGRVSSPLHTVERGSEGEAGGLPILAAGMASPLWMYSRLLFAEAVLACALSLAVMILSSRENRMTKRASPPGPLSGQAREGEICAGIRPLSFVSAGLAFGAGVLTRAALIIYLPALMMLIVRHSAPESRRMISARLVWFGIGLLPFGSGLLAHNALRFGDPLRLGYGGEGFTTPPWEGIIGLLFSPGKSVFVYAPPLILSVILWPRFRRGYPALADFLAVAWGSALIFYGAWWAWHGGWSWGPRLLVPLIPLSMLPLIVLPGRARWRAALVAPILLGALIQIAGVLTDLTPHYAALTTDGSTDYAALHNDLRQIPPVAAARRLLHGQTEPLAAFHLKSTGLPPTWTVGVPVVLLLVLVTSVVRCTYTYRSPATSHT